MMMKETVSFLLEAMSPCTETFFSRSYTYDQSGVCLDDPIGLVGQLEKCRKSRLEAVVWENGTYVGGTWFDVTHQKWTAEFFDQTWNSQASSPTIQPISSGYLQRPG
ncbi:hypothetical protein [Desulfoplanes sp.]